MEKIIITSLQSNKNGTYLTVPRRSEDFWLYFGEMAGWCRFSLLSKRTSTPCQELFELVEVLPPEHTPAPCPEVSIANVLWRRREAILAEIKIQSYLDDLNRREQENFQSV